MNHLLPKFDFPPERVIELVRKVQDGQATLTDKEELKYWIWYKSFADALNSRKLRDEAAESVADKVADEMFRDIESKKFNLQPGSDLNVE